MKRLPAPLAAAPAAGLASAALLHLGTGLHPAPWATWLAPLPVLLAAPPGTGRPRLRRRRPRPARRAAAAVAVLHRDAADARPGGGRPAGRAGAAVRPRRAAVPRAAGAAPAAGGHARRAGAVGRRRIPDGGGRPARRLVEPGLHPGRRASRRADRLPHRSLGHHPPAPARARRRGRAARAGRRRASASRRGHRGHPGGAGRGVRPDPARHRPGRRAASHGRADLRRRSARHRRPGLPGGATCCAATPGPSTRPPPAARRSSGQAGGHGRRRVHARHRRDAREHRAGRPGRRPLRQTPPDSRAGVRVRPRARPDLPRRHHHGPDHLQGSRLPVAGAAPPRCSPRPETSTTTPGRTAASRWSAASKAACRWPARPARAS